MVFGRLFLDLDILFIFSIIVRFFLLILDFCFSAIHLLPFLKRLSALGPYTKAVFA